MNLNPSWAEIYTRIYLFFFFQCNKKHILECEEFSQTGKCLKGTKFKLMHRTRKSTASRKRETTSNEETASDSLKRPKLEFTNDEGYSGLPLQASTSGK